MGTIDFIPQKDDALADWLRVLINYLQTKYNEWSIPQPAVAELDALIQTFTAALELPPTDWSQLTHSALPLGRRFH